MSKKKSPFESEGFTTSTPYATYTNIDYRIRYKLLNNQVKIDLKEIIDKILADAGIQGFNTKQVEFTIPYDIDETASDDTFSLLVDRKRFQIRLPELQYAINKQQKIDWDNTHPHRWSPAQWLKFFEKKFWDTYGIESVELNLRGRQGGNRRGKATTLIRGLIYKIKALNSLECDETSVVEYIVWAFSNKASKISLSLGLVCSDAMIQEWVIWKRKQLKSKPASKIGGKWDDNE